MMALHVGTSLDSAPIALVAFSGALIPPEGLPTGAAKPPVALIHGELDRVVDPAQPSRRRCWRTPAIEVRLLISPGTAHGIAPDGLDFATLFLGRGRRSSA